MPDEISIEEYRQLFGGRRPSVRGRPQLQLPAATRAPADASEKRRQPYCDRGWLFAQDGPTLRHVAWHPATGARVGPAETRRALLAMIDEHERTTR